MGPRSEQKSCNRDGERDIVGVTKQSCLGNDVYSCFCQSMESFTFQLQPVAAALSAAEESIHAHIHQGRFTTYACGP